MVSLFGPDSAVIPPSRPDSLRTMFTSIADVFRIRQALRDLTEAVRINQDAVLRLGTTGAEKDAIARIVEAGCRIDMPGDNRAFTQLLLAAAMPEDDYPAFIAATAILLTDRLRSGGGTDDLYWNWKAFRDHYRLADPPVRAALMNGFRMAEEMGLVNLDTGPNASDCLTRTPEDVLSMLEGSGLDDLLRAIETETPADEAGALWAETDTGTLSWQALTGFRYLYERPASMAPEHPESAALIPWV